MNTRGSWSRTSASASSTAAGSRTRRSAKARCSCSVPSWVSHLEEEWDDPRARSFFEELAQQHHRSCATTGSVPGSRSVSCPARRRSSSTRASLAVGARGVRRRAGHGLRLLVRGRRDRAASPRTSPDRVRKIVFFGGYVSRDDLPDATRRSLVDFVRVELAARGADARRPHRPARERRRDRGAEPVQASRRPTPRRASAFLELELYGDARPFLPHVTMPALVLHRRGDRDRADRARPRARRRCSRTHASSRSAATRTCRRSTTSARSSARSPDSSTTRLRSRRTATRR